MPLVIVNVAPVFEQAPPLENVTGVARAAARRGDAEARVEDGARRGVRRDVIAWSALLTVSEPEPLLGSKERVARERGADAGRVRAGVDARRG